MVWETVASRYVWPGQPDKIEMNQKFVASLHERVLSYQFTEETAKSSGRDKVEFSKEAKNYYNSIDYKISTGWMRETLTDDELACIFADMGKRLDEAYARGEYTESEYNELNGMLDTYIELETDAVETWRALVAIGRERGRMNPRQSYEFNTWVNRITPEEYQKYMREQISAFIKKYGGIDRTALLDKVNTLRYGGDEEQESNMKVMKTAEQSDS